MQNSASNDSVDIGSMDPENNSKHSNSDNASKQQKAVLEQIVEGCESSSGEDIEI